MSVTLKSGQVQWQWYRQVKLRDHHAEFDIYHSYGVQENCNITATQSTGQPAGRTLIITYSHFSSSSKLNNTFTNLLKMAFGIQGLATVFVTSSWIRSWLNLGHSSFCHSVALLVSVNLTLTCGTWWVRLSACGTHGDVGSECWLGTEKESNHSLSSTVAALNKADLCCKYCRDWATAFWAIACMKHRHAHTPSPTPMSLLSNVSRLAEQQIHWSNSQSLNLQS